MLFIEEFDAGYLISLFVIFKRKKKGGSEIILDSIDVSATNDIPPVPEAYHTISYYFREDNGLTRLLGVYPIDLNRPLMSYYKNKAGAGYYADNSEKLIHIAVEDVIKGSIPYVYQILFLNLMAKDEGYLTIGCKINMKPILETIRQYVTFFGESSLKGRISLTNSTLDEDIVQFKAILSHDDVHKSLETVGKDYRVEWSFFLEAQLNIFPFQEFVSELTSNYKVPSNDVLTAVFLVQVCRESLHNAFTNAYLEQPS